MDVRHTRRSVSKGRSPHDFYPTDPAAVEAILNLESFPGTVLEPCAGDGAVVRVLLSRGYRVVSNEPYPRAGLTPDYSEDYLDLEDKPPGVESVVTNPPFALALPFVLKTIALGIDKHAWLLRVQFGEGKTRYTELFSRCQPARVWLFARRPYDMSPDRPAGAKRGSMMTLAWWVWDRRKTGPTELGWISPYGK